jgi:hypothetical protein
MIPIRGGPSSAILLHVRTLVCFCFLICALGCRAQRPEDQVLAVYSQMEKAVQTGDADHAFVGLWSRAKASDAEKMRSQLRPQPDAHYTSSRVYVQADQAVLLGQFSPDGFLSMCFVREDGGWKISDFAFSDKPYSAESVYAVIPPPPGAFERAGSPWQSVPPALDKASAARQGWQLRAASDESFLYIRIESSEPIPAPGTQAQKPPMGWPVMKIAVSGGGDFVLHATANIGDQATFYAIGRGSSHRPYVAYWLLLERADQTVFQAWAGLDPSPLIQAEDHFLTVRVPLRTMGITDASHARITLGDAQWPKSAIFTVQAQPYR